MNFFTFGLLAVLLVKAKCNEQTLAADPNTMRGSNCNIPPEIEESARPAFLTECLKHHYAGQLSTLDTYQFNSFAVAKPKCYPELGCFPMDAPWTGPLRPVPPPVEPKEIETGLYCFTRASRNYTQIQLWPTISLNGCPFSPNRPTAFITHGFSSDGKGLWQAALKNNYLDMVDANVFIVDWGKGAKYLNYLLVASNTRIVGAELARFVKYLIKEKGLLAKDLHLMGHSLGAQISSYVGKQVPGVGRITAMDPAQPCFEYCDARVRINQSDALFVEAIHTNAAPFIPEMGFGMIEAVGHVDFYMNGGLHQPGCFKLTNLPKFSGLSDLKNLSVDAISQWVSCAHGRSYEYFTQALSHDCMLWGRKIGVWGEIANAGTLGFLEPMLEKYTTCKNDSCIPIGLNTPQYQARGMFAASTKMFSPYCDDKELSNKIIADMAGTPAKKDDKPWYSKFWPWG